jgi:DNA-directed RNA polymerase subunit RPC12/RpoP
MHPSPSLCPLTWRPLTEGEEGAVTLTAYCATCERTVYVGEDDTAVCPVCSGSLLAKVDGEESKPSP